MQLTGQRAAFGPRAALRRIPYQPTTEIVSAEFPFLLITGRTRHQFNAGTMTLRTINTVLHPADFLEIAPTDAAHLALSAGARVRLRSHYGEACLPIRLNDNLQPGELFATFHTANLFLNQVTSPWRDH